MKLITEYNDSNIKTNIVESKDSPGTKQYFIEGVFMQADKQNRNGRIYPKKIMETAVKKYYDEQIKTGRAVGELNHPDSPSIDYSNVSHKIVDLRWENNNIIGKALILDTSKGKEVKALMDGGVKLGVSSRGIGSVMEKNGIDYVDDDFILNTIDIVHDPSAPDAFVNGIHEGKEWIISESGTIVERAVVKGANKNDVVENKKTNIKKQLKEFISIF